MVSPADTEMTVMEDDVYPQGALEAGGRTRHATPFVPHGGALYRPGCKAEGLRVKSLYCDSVGRTRRDRVSG